MPPFNPKGITSTLPPVPNDIYECVIGELRPFDRKNAEGNQSTGVNFTLTIAEGEFANRKLFATCYTQSEEAQTMTKRFLIAANNFQNTPEGEAAFDASDAANLDYEFDAPTNTVGTGWSELKGKRVKVQTKIETYNGKSDAKPKNYFPFNPA